jgi:hypothetical protein
MTDQTSPEIERALAEKINLHLQMGAATPGFHLSEDDLCMIVRALLRGHAQTPAVLSEQQRHAVGHARYQVEHSTPENPECCFDYELVATLIGIIDRTLSDTSTDRTWHEAMADRVLQLKIGGAKNLSCDAVLGLIAFVRDGEGSVAVTSPERASK